MNRMVYSVELDGMDRDALARVAAAWSMKRSEALRLAIRVLAEAVDAQGGGAAVAATGGADDAPRGAGAAGGEYDRV